MTRGRTDKLDAGPLLEYFKPLSMWLNVQNRDESLVGWSTTGEDTGMKFIKRCSISNPGFGSFGVIRREMNFYDKQHISVGMVTHLGEIAECSFRKSLRASSYLLLVTT